VKLTEQGRTPKHTAEARFLLARALWDAPVDGGRDRTRAVPLAEQARAGFFEGGEATANNVAEVDAWLREHGAGEPVRGGP
jgi:hypothetical protein